MFRILFGLTLCISVAAWADSGPDLSTALAWNAEAAAEAMAFCQNYAHGWLNQADPETGLLPRNLPVIISERQGCRGGQLSFPDTHRANLGLVLFKAGRNPHP